MVDFYNPINAVCFTDTFFSLETKRYCQGKQMAQGGCIVSL